MTFRRTKPSPVVSYINRPIVTPIGERERQAIQVICDRDERIAVLEFALKEARQMLTCQPAEVGEARRVLDAALEGA